MNIRCAPRSAALRRSVCYAQRTTSRKALALRWTSTQSRQWSTPLAKSLAEAITTTGPISIAQYMRQCLTSPDGGYYTTHRAEQDKDQFGQSGDFVTSPEISQVFGELVGIWFLTEWMAQGQPSSVQLVELGPGRGTLMDDILRTLSNFKGINAAVETIFLVESSPMLRETQRKLLCGENEMQMHPMGYRCQSHRMSNAEVVWVEDIKFLPREATTMPFIVAHEFFDALPIHAFQATEPASQKSRGASSRGIATDTKRTTPQNEWRELLVSPTAPPSFINPPKTAPPEFELTLSSIPTHHSRLLPSISKRYAALLQKQGSTIEISPEALTTMQALAGFISASRNTPTTATTAEHSNNTRSTRPSGAALVVDYGPADTIPISTLRGIKQHTRVSPFSNAGQVDISADVDFGALAEAALTAAKDVEVHGPVEQSDWLTAMGGRERCDMLMNSNDATAEIKERIESGWRRLIEKGPNGMGRLYKVMAVLPLSEGRRPVGFGGHVADA